MIFLVRFQVLMAASMIFIADSSEHDFSYQKSAIIYCYIFIESNYG
jgi:hypothetical protein